jgi:cytoskeletal protein CcmA (bactofilin family)
MTELSAAHEPDPPNAWESVDLIGNGVCLSCAERDMPHAAIGGLMESAARIGASIHIKGEVFAKEPLTIAGKVTGSIDVTGHPLVVTDSGQIAADIVAHTIVIGGRVNGKLLADGRIVVNKTATFAGDLSAPSVSVDDGAIVQGRLEIAGKRQLVS